MSVFICASKRQTVHFASIHILLLLLLLFIVVVVKSDTVNMQSTLKPVHFVLVPFLAPGHLIPMVDLGRLLSERGARVTVITTPSNANRFKATVDLCEQSNLAFGFHTLQLPSNLSLPEGSDNMDSMLSSEDVRKLFGVIVSLEEPLKEYLKEELKKSTQICLVSDFVNAWTCRLTCELEIPRFVFYSVCCFTLSCFELLIACYDREECRMSDVGYPKNKVFVVPEIPHRIEVTQEQAPGFFNASNELAKMVRVLESTSAGIIVNTFEEMEPTYLELHQNIKGKKTWAVGPVALCNKEIADIANRGSSPFTTTAQLQSFLDSMGPHSVIYVCLGSLTRTTPALAEEIGLGLEESGHPFIWVVRSSKMDTIESWLEESKFEERNRGKCLVIKGWAPQVMILSHPSVGAFVTHCGWNSTMEGITAGLPMVTWPFFCDQFLNEKLLVDVVRTGVTVGAKEPVWWWEDAVVVKREMVTEAVKDMMGCTEEAIERRVRAYELGQKARKAMDIDGSSTKNLHSLIQETVKLVEKTEIGESEG